MLLHGFFALATIIFALVIAFLVILGKNKSIEAFYSIIFFRISFVATIVVGLFGFGFVGFGLHGWLVLSWVLFLAIQLSLTFFTKENVKEVVVKMLAVANALFALVVLITGFF